MGNLIDRGWTSQKFSIKHAHIQTLRALRMMPLYFPMIVEELTKIPLVTLAMKYQEELCIVGDQSNRYNLCLNSPILLPN